MSAESRLLHTTVVPAEALAPLLKPLGTLRSKALTQKYADASKQFPFSGVLLVALTHLLDVRNVADRDFRDLVFVLYEGKILEFARRFVVAEDNKDTKLPVCTLCFCDDRYIRLSPDVHFYDVVDEQEVARPKVAPCEMRIFDLTALACRIRDTFFKGKKNPCNP